MPRPKYKELYLNEKYKVYEERGLRRDAEAELIRIKAVLAEEGRRIVAGAPFDLDVDQIALFPLQYEAVSSYIESTARINFGPRQYGYQNVTWRGTPIRMVPYAG
jgi:hypothetical protein